MFASAVKPQLYKVDFGDNAAVAFVDYPAMRPGFQYLRNPNGVMTGGTPIKTMNGDDISALGSSINAQFSEDLVRRRSWSAGTVPVSWRTGD